MAKDEVRIGENRRVEEERRTGAVALHRVCEGFANAMNGLLNRTELVLDPPAFSEDEYLDSDQNFFQIHVRGRVLLLAFGPSEHLLSTENFREPYILEGTVRCFNQDLLEHNSIEEQHIFYCRGAKTSGWRYSNPRTYQSGNLDEEYLVNLFSLLV